MAITVDEMIDSHRSGSGPNPFAERRFLVMGTEDELTARAMVGVASDIYYDLFGVGLLLIRNEIVIEPGATNDHWIGTVIYGGALQADVTGPEEGRVSFDTGGGLQKITHSIRTVNRYAPAGLTPPNFGGAINVTGDGVEGVEISVPGFVFNETYALPNTFVTPAYISTLARLTGTMNVGSFRGFAPGEVLMLGAAGSKRGLEGWEVNFRFAQSPNRTGLVIGDPALGSDWNISNITKRGWDHLWVYYVVDKHPSQGRFLQRPYGVSIEQVYHEGNFAQLGIGA
ncbi:MAG: hypothetical protein IT348_19355 [Candidatus Eisenbacteria bacterium]|nr:hypothetical protein [Candidatus Eisenbacteria bacterium]